MKKGLAVFLVICFFLCLTSCGNKENSGDLTTSVETHTKTIESYINESNKSLDNGKLKEALLALYECIDILGDSNNLQKAIDDYFSRITLIISTEPNKCDEENCFEDTTYTKSPDCKDVNIGLVLVDSKNDIKETIACITLKCDLDYYPLEENDATILGNNDDTWLFTTFSGAGKSSSFLYTIHTNKLLIIEYGLPNWNICGDILIGQTAAYGAGDPTSLYAYYWNGKMLYKKENLCGSSIIYKNCLYYVKINELTKTYKYEIYKTKIDGTENQKLCYVELSKNSYFSLDKDCVRWWDNGKEGSMKLSNLKNIVFEDEEKNENITSDAKAVIVISLEWEQEKTNLDISLNLSKSSKNTATWVKNSLCYSDGTVIATKSKTQGKQIISIFKLEEVYDITIDDLNYGEHLINYVSSSNLLIKNGNKTLVDDISSYMHRAPTGYWYGYLTINNGIVN